MYKENKKAFSYWVIAAMIFCVAVWIFSLMSCSPYKRLQKRKPKNEKETVMLADACIATFPSKTDTVTNYQTDTVEIDNTAERVELNKIIDSLLLEKAKSLQDTALIHELEQRLSEALAETCPPQKVITITKIQTIIKPDSAKEYLLSKHIRDLQVDSTLTHAELTQVTKEKNDIQYKQEHSITYNLEKAAQALLHKWWFWILLAISAALLYFRINPYSIGKNLLNKIIKR